MPDINIRLDEKDAQRLIFAGRSGMGKTTLAASIASRARRAVWIDPKGLNEVGWQTVIKMDRFADLVGANARASLLRRLLEEHGHIVVQLADRPDYAKDPEAADKVQIEAVCEAAYTLGNVLTIVDDMQAVYGSSPTYYLRRIATAGRSRGCGAMCLVTSVISFPLEFLRQSSHIVAFAMHEEADVERLTDVRPGFAAVRELQKYEHVWADLDNDAIYQFGPMAAAKN